VTGITDLKKYRFRMTYGGASTEKVQDTSINAVVEFQTVEVTARLKDSKGMPLDPGTVKYYADGWKDLGVTSEGEVKKQLLPSTYRFRMSYAGASNEKPQRIDHDSVVRFQTGKVISLSRTCTSYYADSWKPFVNGMELLPKTYIFRFKDRTHDTPYKISAGITNRIH
jgi:hypothetical protein